MNTSSAWRGASAAAFLSFAVLASAVGAPAADGPSSAQLTGTVKTGGGSPIGGARVTASGPAVTSTTTDGAGAFTLTVVPEV